jgi:uncharacterized protein YfaS (alpha-2-macroglobulin family)
MAKSILNLFNAFKIRVTPPPHSGKYHLAIVDQEDQIIDSVHFEVRGEDRVNQN